MLLCKYVCSLNLLVQVIYLCLCTWYAWYTHMGDTASTEVDTYIHICMYTYVCVYISVCMCMCQAGRSGRGKGFELKFDYFWPRWNAIKVDTSLLADLQLPHDVSCNLATLSLLHSPITLLMRIMIPISHCLINQTEKVSAFNVGNPCR